MRRALILADINQYPGTTQTCIMERLSIPKSALTREIDWLFNYGCIMRRESHEDGRAIQLQICGYSRKSLDNALDYFEGHHENLKTFIKEFVKAMKMEKPSLRDAKIMAFMYERKAATKQQVLENLYQGALSTDNRSINELVQEGLLTDA